MKAGGFAAGTLLPRSFASAQARKLRVGLMLPYSGPNARIAAAITNGFKLAVDQRGGKLSGREVEFVAVDDAGGTAQAAEKVEKLALRHKAEILIGTVDDGVQLAMIKLARELKTPLIIPHCGMDAATGALCAPNVFRTSASHWQPSYPTGKLLAARGMRTVVSISWKYSPSEESIAAFTEGFIKGGGTLVRGFWLSFPKTDFHAVLGEIASIKPDAIFASLTGGGAAALIKEYHTAGLAKTIPLFGTGFLTEGSLARLGGAAEGIETALHYADGLAGKRNREFRQDYANAYRSEADVYAVQGYDAALLLAAGLDAVKGDVLRQRELIAAMGKARIDSPRGFWKMSKAHNPIQDIYLRKVIDGENRFMRVLARGLADPARGCKI